MTLFHAQGQRGFFHTSVFCACSPHPRYHSGTKKSKKSKNWAVLSITNLLPGHFLYKKIYLYILCMASALAKIRKISKNEDNIFSWKFRPLSWVFGNQKMQKNAKIGCFDHLGLRQIHFCSRLPFLCSKLPCLCTSIHFFHFNFIPC